MLEKRNYGQKHIFTYFYICKYDERVNPDGNNDLDRVKLKKGKIILQIDGPGVVLDKYRGAAAY